MVDTSLIKKSITYKLEVTDKTYDEIPPWIIISVIEDMMKHLGIKIKIEEEAINDKILEITLTEKNEE